MLELIGDIQYWESVYWRTAVSNFCKLLLLVFTFCGALASCSPSERPSTKGASSLVDLDQMAVMLAASSGYRKDAIELTASRVRLAVFIADADLALLDEASRAGKAASLVALIEELLPKYPELAGLQAISIAIIHPNAPGAASTEWHTEDVLEYRRGTSQRFTIHIS